MPDLRRRYPRAEPGDYRSVTDAQGHRSARAGDPDAWKPRFRPARNGIPVRLYVYRGLGYDIYEQAAEAVKTGG